MTSFEEWLSAEKKFIAGHRGLAHPFFGELPEVVTSSDFLSTALRQIYHVVLGFPFHIAGAVASTRDEAILRALVHNLYAEVGGANGEAHIEIYRRLLRACGGSLERPERIELWDETVDLEATCARLYRDTNLGMKLGSLFAFEMMSSPMVARWDAALRRVSWLIPHDFEFFTIHIDIEAEHVFDIAECTRPYVGDALFRRNFHAAEEQVMFVLERFWDRMHAVYTAHFQAQDVVSR